MRLFVNDVTRLALIEALGKLLAGEQRPPRPNSRRIEAFLRRLKLKQEFPDVVFTRPQIVLLHHMIEQSRVDPNWAKEWGYNRRTLELLQGKLMKLFAETLLYGEAEPETEDEE